HFGHADATLRRELLGVVEEHPRAQQGYEHPGERRGRGERSDVRCAVADAEEAHAGEARRRGPILRTGFEMIAGGYRCPLHVEPFLADVGLAQAGDAIVGPFTALFELAGAAGTAAIDIG